MKSFLQTYGRIVIVIIIGSICLSMLTDDDSFFTKYIAERQDVKEVPPKENFSSKLLSKAENNKPVIECDDIVIKVGTGDGTFSNGKHYLTRDQIVSLSGLKVYEYQRTGDSTFTKRNVTNAAKIYPYDDPSLGKRYWRNSEPVQPTGLKRDVPLTDQAGQYSIKVFYEDTEGLTVEKTILVVIDKYTG